MLLVRGARRTIRNMKKPGGNKRGRGMSIAKVRGGGLFLHRTNS